VKKRLTLALDQAEALMRSIEDFKRQQTVTNGGAVPATQTEDTGVPHKSKLRRAYFRSIPLLQVAMRCGMFHPLLYHIITSFPCSHLCMA
jgi:hypothetical protein